MTDRMSIAEIAESTGTSPKTIRAYLRRNHARSAELKNSRWGNAKQGYALSQKLTAELLDHFAPKDEEVEAE